MATFELEFGALGDTRPVPPLTVRTTDPNVLSRTVVDHARPYIAPVLEEMGRPELADALFRVNRDRTMGQFLWLDLAGGKGAEFLPVRITTTPERIQRKRTAGWTSNGAKYVGRGTRWGNPFRVGDKLDMPHGGGEVIDRTDAVALYRVHLRRHPDLAAAARTELAGRDLMCWCPLVDDHGMSVPCHADVLLHLANTTQEAQQ